MMATPKILKGGFLCYETDTSPGRVITFQYNPESLQRTIAPAENHSHAKETTVFTLSLDATGALEHADPSVPTLGILPALCALESLVQPADTIIGSRAGTRGKRSTKKCLLTLFLWGQERVVPVRVVQLIVREQMFGTSLNPIRANVDVTLETLTDAELKKMPRARTLMDAYLDKKESLAKLSSSAPPPENPAGGSRGGEV